MILFTAFLTSFLAFLPADLLPQWLDQWAQGRRERCGVFGGVTRNPWANS
jgi:hypothetical protein